MNNYLISVVSASWNQGRFVEECIQSVAEEYREQIEHIVIDNCSDDETHEVLARYPHLRVVVEPDKGQSEALNKGFQRASAEWVLWLNIDDFLMPGALEKYLEIVQQKGESLDMIYGHMVFVDAEGDRMRTLYQPQWFYWMTILGSYVAPSTGSLYRTSVLQDNPLDEEFHMIMDSEWMLRNGKKLRVKRLFKEMVSFRISEENKTSANITDGIITPRHHSERVKLTQKYPCYGNGNESDKSSSLYFILKIVRRAIRIWILVDKGFAKALAGWR